MSPYADNFWPEEIKPTIQSPFAILKRRANELTQKTRGVLIGRVSTSSNDTFKNIYHQLEVEVPALKNFRQSLLTVRHGTEAFYPCFVDSTVLVKSVELRIKGVHPEPQNHTPVKLPNEASSDVELEALLKKVVNADQVKSTLVSLIVQANEAVTQSEDEARSHRAEAPEEEEIDTEEPEETEQDS